MAWVIGAGVTHFHAAQAFDFPPGAFTPSTDFFTGLGAAMLVTAYDYWGYYNICYLAGEVEKPERNVPRAVLISVGLVAAIYLLMNVSVLGVIPWQQLQGQVSDNARSSVISVFMQQIYGGWAGKLVTLLIMWTAFGSIFSLLLGYSRVPYAAALDGNYFAVFGRLHPRYKFPYVSLLVLGAVATAFCVLAIGRSDRRAGGDSHPAAISLAAGGPVDSARAASGDAASFPHVAVSAAGALRHRRVRLHADLAAEFPAGDSLRRRGAGRWAWCYIFCAPFAAANGLLTARPARARRRRRSDAIEAQTRHVESRHLRAAPCVTSMFVNARAVAQLYCSCERR